MGKDDGAPPPIHFGAVDADAVFNAKQGEGKYVHRGNAVEIMEFNEQNVAAKKAQEQLKAAYDEKKRIQNTVVPTDDKSVKMMLRSLGEPICLFGENAGDRRSRLKELVAMGAGGALPTDGGAAMATAEEDKPKETVYTKGPEALVDARKHIAAFSLKRARTRLEQQRKERAAEVEADKEKEKEQEKEQAEGGGGKEAKRAASAAAVDAPLAHLKSMANTLSQNGDGRPLLWCAYSPCGSGILTTSSSGMVRLWDANTCEEARKFRGHSTRVAAAAWHPQADVRGLTSAGGDGGSSGSSSGVALATGGADTHVKLWRADEETAVSTLEGHTSRVSCVDFHPSAAYVGSASLDGTFRLWDMATGTCLQDQDGHSRGLAGVSFQADGSLAATVGLDCYAIVWDLRRGRMVREPLEGHVRPVLTVDFSPNGYHMATGSEDHTIRIWDLRKMKTIYTIPAHDALVRRVRFEPTSGRFLASAAFDNTAKVFNGTTWNPLATLAGHDNKVQCVDIAPDGRSLVTCSADTTWKLWQPTEAAMEHGNGAMQID